MHELSVVVGVIETIETYAKDHEIGEIETLVLQIGEMSAVVPSYTEACFPVAAHGTILENTKLEIEILFAMGKCGDCSAEYRVPEHRSGCLACGSKLYKLISGREFYIKEIVAASGE